MTRITLVVLSLTLLSTGVMAQSDGLEPMGFWDGVKASIQRNLGRPYVWGAAGMKSFDCSGFVWRVMSENGILVKRTTARKFYMALPKATPEDQSAFGTLVFFNDLKHIGIVSDATSFYHAQVSLGTNLSAMTPFWKRQIYGFRKLPVPENQ